MHITSSTRGGEICPLLAACNNVLVMFPDERTNPIMLGDMAIAYTVYARINHESTSAFWMQGSICSRLVTETSVLPSKEAFAKDLSKVDGVGSKDKPSGKSRTRFRGLLTSLAVVFTDLEFCFHGSCRIRINRPITNIALLPCFTRVYCRCVSQ